MSLVTTPGLQTALSQIDEHSSMGPDGIHPMLLKACAAELAEPLTVVFNKSIQEGVVPNRWKVAVVTPIYKKSS